jgi:hypothetical protein
MDFIEQLKQLGGVKPCPSCKGYLLQRDAMGITGPCPTCHATGSILDLAPLLAKPEMLLETVRSLRSTDGTRAGYFRAWWKEAQSASDNGLLHVVGPQRASNFVYEVARQMGGTAVVAEPKYEVMCDHDDTKLNDDVRVTKNKDGVFVEGTYRTKAAVGIDGYRLSLPVPPDATVLFVTDRMGYEDRYVEEIHNIMKVMGRYNMLPYVLCLVSHRIEGFDVRTKVISLHQE